MEKYYANCTIIEKNVLFDVGDNIDIDLEVTFEHIEEVYGNIQIEGNGITQVTFLNLRIIRGEELATKDPMQGKLTPDTYQNPNLRREPTRQSFS